jgi:hypothetical protein
MSDIFPVSRERHGRRAWNKDASYMHARGERIVAVALPESMQLMMGLPLAFVPQENQFVFVALLGLRAGENLWVGPEGRWLGPRVPAALQHYPFRLLRNTDGKELLGVDEAGLVPPEIPGASLFDAEGKPAPELTTILEQLSQGNRERQQTRQTVALLQQYGLLEPWPLVVADGGEKRPIEGLYRVAEKKLGELPGDVLVALRNGAALTLAYVQLLSMQHTHQLARMAEAYAVAKQRSSASASENPIGEHGIISFANL